MGLGEEVPCRSPPIACRLSRVRERHRPGIARGSSRGFAHKPHYRGGADAAIFNGPGFPSAANTTVDNGGDPILMHAQVALIFYGNAWNGGTLNPSAAAVQSAIQVILDSNYCSGLAVYSCTGGDMDTDWNRIVPTTRPRRSAPATRTTWCRT